MCFINSFYLSYSIGDIIIHNKEGKQKEWGNGLISEHRLKGNERILDLGWGDAKK